MTANPLSTIPPIGPASGMPPGQRPTRLKPVDPLKLLRAHWLLLTITAVLGIIVGLSIYWVWSHKPLPVVPEGVSNRVERVIWPVRKHLDPQYTSKAQLRIDPPPASALDTNTGGLSTQDRGLETTLATTAVQIQSDVVLDRAATRIATLHKNPAPGFEPLSWFVNEHGGNIEKAKTAIKDDMVSARPKAGTRLVEINVSTREEADAAVILRAILDEYIGMVKSQRESEGVVIGGVFTDRRGQIQRDMSELEKKISRFLRMHGDAPVLTKGVNAAEFQYGARLKRLEEIELLIVETEQYLATLTRQAAPPAAQPGAEEADAPPADAEPADAEAGAAADGEPLQGGAGEAAPAAVAPEVSAVASSEWERDLVQTAVANGMAVPTQADLTQMRMNYPEVARKILNVEQLGDLIEQARAAGRINHRETKNLIRQEAQLRQSLVQDILIKQQVISNERRRSAEAQLESLKRNRAEVESELKQLDDKRSALKQRLSEWESYQEEKAILAEQQKVLNQAMFNKELLDDRPDIDQIKLVEPPTEAQMTWPKWQMLIPATTLLFLGIVTGLLFLREMLDQRVMSPADVGLIPDADMLGMLPDSKEDPSGTTAVDRVVERQPTGLLAESYRQVRTAVLARMDRRGYKTLAVTSPQPGAGTTTVAHNLATSFAMNNRQVLLVDANFRRPSLGETYGIDARRGLVQVLRGEAELHEVVHELEGVGLSVLPAGDVSEATPELLECSMLRTLLGRLETRYDLVVIDTPPVLLAADCQLLTKTVDAIAIIVRAGRDKRGMLSRTIRQLDGQRADVLGTILNGVRTSVGGYFRKSYQQFYRYAETTRRKGGERPLSAPRRRAAQTAPAAGAAAATEDDYAAFIDPTDGDEEFRFDAEDDASGADFGETNGHGNGHDASFDDGGDTERRG